MIMFLSLTRHGGAQQAAAEWHRRMHWRRTSPQSCLQHSPRRGGDNAVLVILRFFVLAYLVVCNCKRHLDLVREVECSIRYPAHTA